MPDASSRILGAWPRGLDAELAARYVGLGESTWLREVREGRAPAPVRLTKHRIIWLREDVDRWLDAQAGKATPSGAQASDNPWDDI